MDLEASFRPFVHVSLQFKDENPQYILKCAICTQSSMTFGDFIYDLINHGESSVVFSAECNVLEIRHPYENVQDMICKTSNKLDCDQLQSCSVKIGYAEKFLCDQFLSNTSCLPKKLRLDCSASSNCVNSVVPCTETWELNTASEKSNSVRHQISLTSSMRSSDFSSSPGISEDQNILTDNDEEVCSYIENKLEDLSRVLPDRPNSCLHDSASSPLECLHNDSSIQDLSTNETRIDDFNTSSRITESLSVIKPLQSTAAPEINKNCQDSYRDCEQKDSTIETQDIQTLYNVRQSMMMNLRNDSSIQKLSTDETSKQDLPASSRSTEKLCVGEPLLSPALEINKHCQDSSSNCELDSTIETQDLKTLDNNCQSDNSFHLNSSSENAKDSPKVQADSNLTAGDDWDKYIVHNNSSLPDKPITSPSADIVVPVPLHVNMESYLQKDDDESLKVNAYEMDTDVDEVDSEKETPGTQEETVEVKVRNSPEEVGHNITAKTSYLDRIIQQQLQKLAALKNATSNCSNGRKLRKAPREVQLPEVKTKTAYVDKEALECAKSVPSLEGKSQPSTKVQPHESSTFSCSECAKPHSSFESHFNHFLKHHSREPIRDCDASEVYTHQCTICDELLKENRKNFQDHIFTHCNHYAWECLECNCFFDGFNSCQNHKRAHSNAKARGKKFTFHKSHESVLSGKAYLSDLRLSELPYNCHGCSTSFVNRTSFKKHFKHSHLLPRTDGHYLCNTCGYSGATLPNFKVHVELKHCVGMVYKCEDCVDEFSTSHQLYNHVKLVHKRGEFKPCQFCNQVMPVKSIISHGYKCKVRQQIVASLRKRNPHAESRFFVCTGCQKTLSELRGMFFHGKIHFRSTSASSDGGGECCLCVISFATELEYLCHFFSEHCVNQTKEQSASKEATRRKTMKEYYSREKTLQCEECSEMFPNIAMLNIHIARKHKLGSFQCQHCSKVCKNELFLKIHINNVHVDRQFHCEHCGDRFKSKHHLDQHLVKHKDETPFKCEICDKAFKRHNTLRGHVLTHKDPQYYCQICEKGFLFDWALKKHQNEKHR